MEDGEARRRPHHGGVPGACRLNAKCGFLGSKWLLTASRPASNESNQGTNKCMRKLECSGSVQLDH